MAGINRRGGSNASVPPDEPPWSEGGVVIGVPLPLPLVAAGRIAFVESSLMAASVIADCLFSGSQSLQSPLLLLDIDVFDGKDLRIQPPHKWTETHTESWGISVGISVTWTELLSFASRPRKMSALVRLSTISNDLIIPYRIEMASSCVTFEIART